MLRLDPRLNPNVEEMVYEEIENEVRGERAHDASVAAVQDRLLARINIPDLINAGR